MPFRTVALLKNPHPNCLVAENLHLLLPEGLKTSSESLALECNGKGRG